MKTTIKIDSKSGNTIITVECENPDDLRVCANIAGSPWIGSAIKKALGKDWPCPFYPAFRAADISLDPKEIEELRKILISECLQWSDWYPAYCKAL